VSIDGRYEVAYPESTVLKAVEVFDPHSPMFEESFRLLQPDLILLCNSSSSLNLAPYFPGSWKVLFREHGGNCEVLGQEAPNTSDGREKTVKLTPDWELLF
jgi:hypothetical protein